MKSMLMILVLIFSTMGFADVWKKPAYTPDENHLPEEQEERPELEDNRPDEKQDEVKSSQEQVEKDSHLEEDSDSKQD